MDDRTELAPGEPHPSAVAAMEYIKTIPKFQLMQNMEAMASCAIEGNRLGEVCAGTIDRLLTGQTVSDRYLLGLAWMLKYMEEGEKVVP